MSLEQSELRQAQTELWRDFPSDKPEPWAGVITFQGKCQIANKNCQMKSNVNSFWVTCLHQKLKWNDCTLSYCQAKNLYVISGLISPYKFWITLLLFLTPQYLQIFNLCVLVVEIHLPGKLWLSGILGASKVRLHLRENFEGNNITLKAIYLMYHSEPPPNFLFSCPLFTQWAFTLRMFLSGLFNFP